MLLNVLVQHLPAAIRSGGYAPGVVTALFVNLPVLTWLLILAARAVGLREKGGGVRGWCSGRAGLGDHDFAVCGDGEKIVIGTTVNLVHRRCAEFGGYGRRDHIGTDRPMLKL